MKKFKNKSNRKCKLCGVDISIKRKNAIFCSPQHRNKYFKYIVYKKKKSNG